MANAERKAMVVILFLALVVAVLALLYQIGERRKEASDVRRVAWFTRRQEGPIDCLSAEERWWEKQWQEDHVDAWGDPI
jgi:hypothetical protein